MTVNTEDTSLQSSKRTGEVELLEFLSQSRAWPGKTGIVKYRVPT
jgi:hypothetical protein